MAAIVENTISCLRVFVMSRFMALLCAGLCLVFVLHYNHKVALTSLRNHCNHYVQPSAASLIQTWADIRAEFVNSLRDLKANGAHRSDKRYTQLVQRHMFSPSNKKYKMSFAYGPPPQTEVAKEYFKSKRQSGGFFVECGGLDGERSSNTYHLEKDGWEGLLIEADPDYFFQSLGKNRRSWKLNAALCPSKNPGIISFKDSANRGHGKLLPGGNHDVPCIPLELAMKALNRTRIDFFSLDVEGLEIQILLSLPYKVLDIHAITMEYNHNKETPEEIIAFMKTVGYKLYKRIDEEKHSQRLYANDLFFVKEET